jgi:hypothetical protein
VAWLTVIVQMWDGPRVITRLGPTAGLTDEEIVRRLQGLNITIPDSAEERLARLAGYPTVPDLRALERIATPDNDGGRPVARVLETVSVGGLRGTAGAVPR